MKLSFLFHVYRDELFAHRLVNQIKEYCKGADILAIFDGEFNPKFADFLRQEKIDYFAGENLKSKQGGLWCQRYHEFFLTQSEADVLIKIDPDTYIHRPLKSIPEADIFGAINQNPGLPIHVRGGFCGFKRSASELLVESKIFYDPFYRSAQFWYPRYGHWKFFDEGWQTEWITLTDPIVGHAAAKLGLTVKSWAEVQGGICFRERVPDNSDLRYLATHPVR